MEILVRREILEVWVRQEMLGLLDSKVIRVKLDPPELLV
jgi:hypothetical protein